jgi:hypothetical protein
MRAPALAIIQIGIVMVAVTFVGAGHAGALGIPVQSMGPTIVEGGRVVLELCGGCGCDSKSGGRWRRGRWGDRHVGAVVASVDGCQ